MAGTVQMNPDQARDWQGQIADLNSRLQSELGGVNESVEQIANDAQGSAVGELTKNVTEMMQTAKELIDSFTNLVDAVGNVIEKATNLVDAVAEGIAKVGKFFI